MHQLSVLTLFFCLALVACAQDEAKTIPQDSPQPRYRLAHTPNINIEEATKGVPVDISWELLTNNGPASGSNPVIGEESGISYLDFRDGLEHPYYIFKASRTSS